MTLIKRELEDKIKKFIERREIIGIRGARQTGKTTLLKMIEEQIEGNKVFIDLYLPEYRKTFEENPLDFVKRFKNEGKLFLFLDEVQKAKDAGEKLKIIYDNFSDIKIFISGSSSLELKTKILPELVGRLFLFSLYTFNFYEFLLARDESLAKILKEKRESLRRFLEDEDEISPPSFQEEIIGYWKEYVVFGGYPEIVKAKNNEERITILKNIFNLYIEKDITGFFGITDTSKFEELVKSLSFNISKILSISSLSSELKIGYENVEKYLEILKHTYVIHLVRPFHKNLVTEIRKSPKVYFLDIGLRNCSIDNFMEFDKRVDKRELSENFVLRELITNFDDWKINFWRTTGKAEVDFVIGKNEKIVPIEVKLSGEKLGKGFYSFLKAYEPEKALIASLDTFEKKRVNNTLIQRIPIYYF